MGPIKNLDHHFIQSYSILGFCSAKQNEQGKWPLMLLQPVQCIPAYKKKKQFLDSLLRMFLFPPARNKVC